MSWFGDFVGGAAGTGADILKERQVRDDRMAEQEAQETRRLKYLEQQEALQEKKMQVQEALKEARRKEAQARGAQERTDSEQAGAKMADERDIQTASKSAPSVGPENMGLIKEALSQEQMEKYYGVKPRTQVGMLIGGGALILLAGLFTPASFMSHFIVFVLSVYVGVQVIWNVSHSLHTPLMAVTNAISSIIILGALMQIGSGNWLVVILAALSVFMAGINIFGGFMVTRRMLAMFQKS